MEPDKKTIQQRFARAAKTYDRQAVMQRRVADRLLALLDRHCLLPPARVLEIGCSTGILTIQVAAAYKNLTAYYLNDLVPEFNSLVQEKLKRSVNPVFLEGDIESIPLPPALDLIISSSTFHWLHNLPLLLERLHGSMSPQGTLCFSIYSTENLRELRAVTGIGLDYYPLAELRIMVEQKFRILACGEELLTYHFADPLAILHHLRETGVNALGTKPWTRSRLDVFSREYSGRFGTGQGVPLTYHPLYCVARKE